MSDNHETLERARRDESAAATTTRLASEINETVRRLSVAIARRDEARAVLAQLQREDA